MQNVIADNLRDLREGIEHACTHCGRTADEITIVAVTKTHPAEVIRLAVAAGLTEIGESRVQEAESKITEVGPIARFHMIGHLQSNKVKKAVRLFDVIESVDSLSLAEEISGRAEEIGKTVECLIEIHSTGEIQKSGVDPELAAELISKVKLLSNIRLTGLMTVGPLTDDEVVIGKAFRLCRKIFEHGREMVGEQFRVLSMGMSDDYRLAILEGATMIRIGTGLFGPRPPLST
jgi:pyridoxal phosphate enzyme (YggS family)